ncbi:F-box only protein 42-like [Branchiostoma floridae]|uniref:F-box only protein 42-like n=1 Tax=Branchiostoma floridae TaxID=7739 RepID=A0A9J7N911_BRAFL|nr:F-box only protein 42-like [Branchiostoma floridae]
MDDSAACSGFSVNELPEEVLERILLFLSPYGQYKTAALVCKLWRRLIKGVSKQHYQSFITSIGEGAIQWQTIRGPSHQPQPAPRISHSACYFDDDQAMYVFGGSSVANPNTCFNDLWRFDLASEEWVRPLASGSYPSPKAWASLLRYKRCLVLFGGCARPSPYPYHQPERYFDEIHLYTPTDNRWNNVVTSPSPPPVAGHGASVIGDRMVVIGGSLSLQRRSNDVWVLNLQTMEWTMQQVQGTPPLPRFGHTQVVLDDQTILIIGGCGGANQNFSDAWMLRLDTTPWTWTQLGVDNENLAAPHIWCHPGCKVGNYVVFLSQDPNMSNMSSLHNKPSPLRLETHRHPSLQTLRRLPPSFDPSQCPHGSNGREERRCENGVRGSFARPVRTLSPQPSTSGQQEQRLRFGPREARDVTEHDGASRSLPVQPSTSGHQQQRLRFTPRDASDKDEPRGAWGGSSGNISEGKRPNLPNGSASKQPKMDSLQSHAGTSFGDPTVPSTSRANSERAELGRNMGSLAMFRATNSSDGSIASGSDFVSNGQRVVPRGQGLSAACLEETKPMTSGSEKDITSPFQPATRPVRRVEDGYNVDREEVGHRDVSSCNDRKIKSPLHRFRCADVPRDCQTCMGMHMYVLDVSAAQTTGRVRWLEMPNNEGFFAPEETSLHSVVMGRGDVIVYGGMESVRSKRQTGIRLGLVTMPNKLYRLTARRV